MDTKSNSVRILMFPWLAHGHISPFLQLAKSLAKRNFVIYICSTQINLNSIKTSLSEKDSISIKLVQLHLPTSPNLPPHHHTTNGLPPHLMPTLKKHLDMARPALSTLLRTLKPDLLIYDFIQLWAPLEASSQNIPAVLFFTTGAAASSYLIHQWLGLDQSKYPFPSIFFREHQYEIQDRLLKSDDVEYPTDQERTMSCVSRSSDIVLIKSFREIEGKYIDYLSAINSKKFIPVGPLVHDTKTMNSENEIVKWLDEKEERSTIFASFGSEYFLSENEMEGIALGLEMSGFNFIWVVRFPIYDEKIKKMKIASLLPLGFLERVGGRGRVVEGWVPQKEILSHKSIGGFLSHCGWSSVMEGIYYNVPIIAVPMHLDQPLNARLVEEVGFGKEVVRDGEGKLDGGEVARVVKKVVVGDECVRRKVGELREYMMRGNGEAGIDDVVEELMAVLGKRERLSNLSPANSMNKLNHLMISSRDHGGVPSINA